MFMCVYYTLNIDYIKWRSHPIEKEVKVRVIPYQLKGFRAARLITNIFDEYSGRNCQALS